MKSLSIVFALLVLAVVIYVVWQSPPSAPPASFTTLTGETLELKKLRGKPVLVTFWATDCRTCVEEIPHLIALQREFKDAGLTIIAVAMFYDPPIHVVRMAKEKQLPYPVALDPQGKLARAFGDVRLTPNHFLIAPNGLIIQHTLGRLDLDLLRTTLRTF